MRWQKAARLVIAGAAVAFAVVVVSRVRQRVTPVADAPVARTDPNALIESAGGRTIRVNREREEIRVEYDQLLQFPEGTAKMLGVRVTTERAGGRTFVMTGREGRVAEGESSVELVGDVRVTASDGLVLTTDRATYLEAEGIARASGRVDFERGRMSGSGVGFAYDKARDSLTIFDQAALQVRPDETGSGAMRVEAGAMEFVRPEHSIRFDRAVKVTRVGQSIDADAAVAHLSDDESRVVAIDLRGHSRLIASPNRSRSGGLESLRGRDIDLTYAEDGSAVQRALLNGDAAIRLAGGGRQAGREITAGSLDVSMAADGVTPTALQARGDVRVELPALGAVGSRSIRASTLDSRGDGTLGLTSAHFEGDVRFDERGAGTSRTVRSAVLDASLDSGFGAIGEAIFSGGVRFTDGAMMASASRAAYVPGKGTLLLSGGDGLPARVVNEQLTVDADTTDVTLEGPIVRAKGQVKSVLQPRRGGVAGGAPGTRLPSLLKEGQPVNVMAQSLEYDGHASKATYTGAVQLWQGETQIKGASLVVDSRMGDLAASGPMSTVAVLVQDDGEGRRERVRSVASADAFTYRETDRVATYAGKAHVNGPQGDLAAGKIELYFKPSGDELDRLEAYDAVTLNTERQRTTGERLTYFSQDNRYVVSGVPVSVVDECGRETTGRTLTFHRSTDRILVDGNAQIRTQTRGKSNCPGS